MLGCDALPVCLMCLRLLVLLLRLLLPQVYDDRKV